MKPQQETNNIHATTVKLAVFYEHNPAGWFLNIEAQFATSRINSEKTKFYHVITDVSPSVSEEIQHFLETECASNNQNPYANLKKCTVVRKPLT